MQYVFQTRHMRHTNWCERDMDDAHTCWQIFAHINKFWLAMWRLSITLFNLICLFTHTGADVFPVAQYLQLQQGGATHLRVPIIRLHVEVSPGAVQETDTLNRKLCQVNSGSCSPPVLICTMSVKLNALCSDSYVDISQYRDQHFKVSWTVRFIFR